MSYEIEYNGLFGGQELTARLRNHGHNTRIVVDLGGINIETSDSHDYPFTIRRDLSGAALSSFDRLQLKNYAESACYEHLCFLTEERAGA